MSASPRELSNPRCAGASRTASRLPGGEWFYGSAREASAGRITCGLAKVAKRHLPQPALPHLTISDLS